MKFDLDCSKETYNMWCYFKLRIGTAPKESLYYNQESKFAILAFTTGWITKSFHRLLNSKSILTYAYTQTHHFKKERCLATNPVDLITDENVTRGNSSSVGHSLCDCAWTLHKDLFIEQNMLQFSEAVIPSPSFLSPSFPSSLSIFPFCFHLTKLMMNMVTQNTLFCWVHLANIKTFCLPLWGFPHLQITSCSPKWSNYFTEKFWQCAHLFFIPNV